MRIPVTVVTAITGSIADAITVGKADDMVTPIAAVGTA